MARCAEQCHVVLMFSEKKSRLDDCWVGMSVLGKMDSLCERSTERHARLACAG